MTLSDGHLEDLRNHFNDGYELGLQDGAEKERNRILTIIGLDLLTTVEVKDRLEALIYGGYENVPKR